MLIECRKRRGAQNPRVGRKDLDAGSKTTVFGTLYHFRPQPDLTMDAGDPLAHVCEVTDPRAIQRFLSIPEGYNEFGKPPRIPANGAAPAGQPAVVTELLDEGDTLAAPESPPYVADPLAKAREIQKTWIATMLAKPVNVIVKSMVSLDATELALLYAAELEGEQRSELLAVLHPDGQPDTGGSPEIQME